VLASNKWTCIIKQAHASSPWTRPIARVPWREQAQHFIVAANPVYKFRLAALTANCGRYCEISRKK
jgi:hypothetical protein